MAKQPDSIYAVVPALARWRNAPRLLPEEASSVRDVGITAYTWSALPVGDPGPTAPPAVQVAHLLRERARYGPAIAIVPGTVAAAFAAQYRAADAALWDAPGGPTDVLGIDGRRHACERPDGPPLAGLWPLLDADDSEPELFALAAFQGALGEVSNLGLAAWDDDGFTGLSRAAVNASYQAGGQSWRLQGSLVARGGVVLCERGHEAPDAEPPIAVSWLVAWLQTPSRERGSRLNGPQIELVARAMTAS
jgi:hypothetical protein